MREYFLMYNWNLVTEPMAKMRDGATTHANECTNERSKNLLKNCSWAVKEIGSWRCYKFVAVAVEIIVAGTISMHLLPIVPFNVVLLTIVVFVFVGDGEGSFYSPRCITSLTAVSKLEIKHLCFSKHKLLNFKITNYQDKFGWRRSHLGMWY